MREYGFMIRFTSPQTPYWSAGQFVAMSEKIEVLDLIINCLKEYEKDLQVLVDRLEKAVTRAERA